MNIQDNTTKKALIYCRVSTEDQAKEGYSLDAQEKFCGKFAEEYGYQTTKIYRDEGKSGTSLNRPALQDLLAQCQQDKSVNAVIVQETDRLARNTKDHLTIRAILKKADIKLISVAQPMLDDSPEGNMIDTILASVNQFQSDINSRKTKKGLQEKFNSGWFPGWAPLGYINKTVNDKNITVPDPEKWHLVKESLKMYLTGNYSAIEIADTLYKKGLTSKMDKKICNSVMIHILKNPFYCGLMRWNDQERVGKHEEMITLSEHKQILTIMSAHNCHASRRRKHNFLLRGFIFCDICGQRYVAEKHRTGKKIDYYHCSARTSEHSNKGQNISVEELEGKIEEKFKEIQFTEELINLTIQKVKKFYQEKKKGTESQKRVLLNKKVGIEEKRRIAEEKLIASVLSDDDFVRMRDRFKERIKCLQNEINELENKHDIDIDTIRETLSLSKNVYKAYKDAPYEIKRLYLSFFWDGFWLKDKKIIKAEPTKLLKTLQNEGKIIIRSDWLPGLDSNL
jgi:site-specific DNA recombinase